LINAARFDAGFDAHAVKQIVRPTEPSNKPSNLIAGGEGRNPSSAKTTGGHIAAWELPALLSQELRAAFPIAALRQKDVASNRHSVNSLVLLSGWPLTYVSPVPRRVPGL